MQLISKPKMFIEEEEGLALLNAWENTGAEGMKMYGDLNPFLKVGNILRELHKKDCHFVKVNVDDYFAFSINLITNPNLMNIEKIKNFIYK